MSCRRRDRMVSLLQEPIRSAEDVSARKHSQNINALFDSVFLHEGHIASSASSLPLISFAPSAGVDSADPAGLREVSKMKLTGISCLRLDKL